MRPCSGTVQFAGHFLVTRSIGRWRHLVMPPGHVVCSEISDVDVIGENTSV